MEKTASQKINLGLFVISGLLIFILAVYFIGDKQKMFGKTNHLEAVFINVNGLQLGNNVRYSGISVGTVRGIKMVNDTTIRVDMIIDKAIFSDHFAFLEIIISFFTCSCETILQLVKVIKNSNVSKVKKCCLLLFFILKYVYL